VVTPGLRSACRNITGLPDCDSGPIYNNQPGHGVTYLVRDDYFEPERGTVQSVAFRHWRTNGVSGVPVCSKRTAVTSSGMTQWSHAILLRSAAYIPWPWSITLTCALFPPRNWGAL